MSKFDTTIESLRSKGLATPAIVERLRAKERELGPYASDAAQEAAIVEILKTLTGSSSSSSSSSSSGEEIVLTDKQKATLAATQAAIEEGFARKNWKYKTNVLRADYVKYTLSFNADNWTAGIDMVVYAETDPDCCSIKAIIPVRGEKIYEYNICTLLAKFNQKLRYGAFQYDERDGEITFEYNIQTERGLDPDVFIRMFSIVLSTADDDDYSPIIRKYSVGRFTREEISEITGRLNRLIKDIQ